MATPAAPVLVRMVDPSTLTPYARNTKRHTDAQVRKLAGLIAAHGFDVPIVVDRKGVIVKGHGRHLAAIQLGLSEVPVIVTEADDETIAANRIADNQIVSLEYDDDVLKFELGTLARANVNLQLTGIDTGRLETLMADMDRANESLKAELEEMAAKAAPAKPRKKKGATVIGEAAGAVVIHFDDPDQLDRWQKFEAWLRDAYQGDTLAALLDAFLRESFESSQA